MIHSKSRQRLQLLLLSVLMGWVSAAHAFEPLPQLERHFRPFHTGWIGADGIYSIPLRNQTLWLFGDTLMGEMQPTARTISGMLRNTAALQVNQRWHFKGAPGPTLQQDFFRSPDPGRWFWPGPGLFQQGSLSIMLPQFEHVPGEAAFQFKQTATYLAQIQNPQAPLNQWRFDYTPLPWKNIAYTVAAVKAQAWWYIYGYRDVQRDGRRSQQKRQAYLMRLPLQPLARDSASALAQAEFWDGRGWSSQADSAAPLFTGFQSEGSVHYHAPTQSYWMVYTADDFSGQVMLRTAPHPSGPWSSAQVLFRMPEHGQDGIFCYAAKAHPQLKSFLPSHLSEHAVVIAYACNTFEPPKLESRPDVYLPRFVAVQIDDEEESADSPVCC